MNLGKLKLNTGGIFSSKWDFYEYARHSVIWSMESAKALMTGIGSSSILTDVPYVKSDNFYMQLMAAYTSTYWHYLYFANIVPQKLLNDSASELKRGMNDGIESIKVGSNKIDPYFVKLYHQSFRKYLKGTKDIPFLSL